LLAAAAGVAAAPVGTEQPRPIARGDAPRRKQRGAEQEETDQLNAEHECFSLFGAKSRWLESFKGVRSIPLVLLTPLFCAERAGRQIAKDEEK
jgi:hypothetical protein